MESKEALKRIRREAGFPYFSTLYDIDMWREDFKTIERDLDKLNQLEDIEKELGVSLITLFKALKGDNFYSKHPETGEVSWIPLPELYYAGRKWNIGCVSMIFNEQERCCDGWDCDPKDYGKTWALTKEELE